MERKNTAKANDKRMRRRPGKPARTGTVGTETDKPSSDGPMNEEDRSGEKGHAVAVEWHEEEVVEREGYEWEPEDE